MIKCPKCGWEYPDLHPSQVCKFCKTKMHDNKRCPVCMESKPASEFIDNRCKECTKKRVKTYRIMDPIITTNSQTDTKLRQYTKASIMLQELAALTEQISTRTLTEADWLKACNYFNGCAFCDSEQIETRTYFVPFQEGGKYNALNILPTCATCGLKLTTLQGNPFVAFYGSVNRTKVKYSYDKMEKIMDYFRSL